MEARYKLELRDRDPSKIVNLSLDNCKDESIKGLDDKLIALENLSLMNIGLKSLEGFPYLPAVKVVDLSENNLSEGLDIIARQCPALERLILSNNKFADLEVFTPLKDLTSLNTLDLFNNEVHNVSDFRQKMFALIPSLMDVDGEDANGEPIDLDDEELAGEDEDIDADSNDEEDDGPGLSYLQSSHILEDEDETEDFEAVDKEEKEGGADGPSTRKAAKRRHEGSPSDP